MEIFILHIRRTSYIISWYYTANLNEGLIQHTEIAIWIQGNMRGSECIVTILCFLQMVPIVFVYCYGCCYLLKLVITYKFQKVPWAKTKFENIEEYEFKHGSKCQMIETTSWTYGCELQKCEWSYNGQN